MDVTVDNFGRIVIPKKVRERLGLQPGAKLRLDIEKGSEQERLFLEPLREAPVLQRRGHLLVHTGELTGDASDVLRTDREERMQKLMGL